MPQKKTVSNWDKTVKAFKGTNEDKFALAALILYSHKDNMAPAEVCDRLTWYLSVAESSYLRRLTFDELTAELVSFGFGNNVITNSTDLYRVCTCLFGLSTDSYYGLYKNCVEYFPPIEFIKLMDLGTEWQQKSSPEREAIL